MWIIVVIVMALFAVLVCYALAAAAKESEAISQTLMERQLSGQSSSDKENRKEVQQTEGKA